MNLSLYFDYYFIEKLFRNYFTVLVLNFDKHNVTMTFLYFLYILLISKLDLFLNIFKNEKNILI